VAMPNMLQLVSDMLQLVVSGDGVSFDSHDKLKHIGHYST
jgi:hypothetical protein